MKKLACLFLSFLLLALGCTGGEDPGTNPDEESPPYYAENDHLTVDKSRLYGIAEPFWEKKENSEEFQVKGFDKEVMTGHLEALGTTSVRFMFPQKIFKKYAMYGENDFEIELDSEIEAYLKECLALLSDAGVKHIIGEAAIYPKPQGFAGGYLSLTVPSREEKCYADWCALLSELWRTLAASFPEITYWEMGNETNCYSYMSPVSGRFSFEEQAAINTDLMYYASKGIRAGNPNAYTVTPGWTSLGTMTEYADSLTDVGYSIPLFLEQIYKNIASGEFPYGETKSTEIEDYFQCIGYHPYEYRDWSGWVEGNERVFEVIDKYDTVARKVLLTEMGWPDYGDPEEMAKQEIWIAELYERCAAMPQVETVCYFRLYDCAYASQWGSGAERSFGLFTEPEEEGGVFAPKQKAVVLQEIFGGTKPLEI